MLTFLPMDYDVHSLFVRQYPCHDYHIRATKLVHIRIALDTAEPIG